MILPNVCSLCLHDVKSIDHFFIHCHYASEIWARLLKEIGLSWIIPNRVDWLLASWGVGKVSKKGNTICKLVCPTVYWLIWLERNKRVFEGCLKPAINVACRIQEVACFGGFGHNHLGEFSVMSTVRDWGRIFQV